MKNRNVITLNNNHQATIQQDVIHLIDVFVEMCFEDINSVQRISQFKILALQLGYTQKIIEKVVRMGKSEYSKLLDEINMARA